MECVLEDGGQLAEFAIPHGDLFFPTAAEIIGTVVCADIAIDCSGYGVPVRLSLESA